MAANRVYQDFEPFFEWTEDEGSATLVVMLPGFIKEQLKVQVTSTGILRINGERQMTENIWRRFGKEFSVPSYCDTNDVSAKFDRGMLSIKFPKLITQAKSEEQEAITNQPEESPKPQQKPSAEPTAQAQVVDQQESQKKEQVSDEKEKNKIEEIAPENVGKKNESTNGVSERAKVEAPKAQEKQQQQQPKKMTQRLKTRLLDFSKTLRDDQNVNQGFGNKRDQVKRRKILMNMIVVILLVMVLGVYIKNAFRSPCPGESKFQEF